MAVFAHQGVHSRVGSPPSRGCGDHVTKDSTLPMQHRDGVWHAKIVTEGIRAQACALVIRASQQVLDEVAAQPQLRFRQDTMMGKLECQHSRGVFQRDDVQTIGNPLRIVQQHHAKDVRLLPDKPEDRVPSRWGVP